MTERAWSWADYHELTNGADGCRCERCMNSQKAGPTERVARRTAVSGSGDGRDQRGADDRASEPRSRQQEEGRPGAHSPDAGGNRAEQGAPAERVESPHTDTDDDPVIGPAPPARRYAPAEFT